MSVNTSERHEVAVIGAGQADLVIRHSLSLQGKTANDPKANTGGIARRLLRLCAGQAGAPPSTVLYGVEDPSSPSAGATLKLNIIPLS